MSETQRYDRRTIMFHWLTAVLIAALWLIAQFIDDFPTALRIYARSTHILLGVVLTLVLIGRLWWRATGKLVLPPDERLWMRLAAVATHYGLYILVAATLVLGLVYEAVRADNLFNLGRLPSIAPGNKDLRNQLGDLHGTLANIVLIVAGVHAAAGLFHHYVMKDNVLLRMMPRRVEARAISPEVEPTE